jgi:hypothetical protein
LNNELIREELDLVEELREGATLREATLKQKIEARHKRKVIKREFEVGSLVLRRNQKEPNEGSLPQIGKALIEYEQRPKTEHTSLKVYSGKKFLDHGMRKN